MVVAVKTAPTLDAAASSLEEIEANTIFIDPISMGIEEAADFIFSVRHDYPEILFVLYLDRLKAEKDRAEFYRGQRRRFSHYYTLDKRTPVAAFQDEVHAVLSTCQLDLGWKISAGSIGKLLEKVKRLPETVQMLEPKILIDELTELLATLLKKSSPTLSQITTRSVFLSYRFVETEYISGLADLLQQHNFSVVTAKTANTYVSKAILDRIRSCQYFLCLMSRDQPKADGTFTTSPWLLEEKGAALALGKPIVLMVEEGVSDYGGLQGDWQRIHFGPKGFLKAALQAVEQLKSYAGDEASGT